MFLDCFETLSREVLKNRNQHNRRDACVLLFYREEYALSSEPKKKKHTQKKAKHKPAFSVGELLFVILKRERCTEEKSSIFATKVTVLFLQHGFEILQTFQKLQSPKLSYPSAHPHWCVFDFEPELKNFNPLMNVFRFPYGGSQTALFKIRKRP